VEDKSRAPECAWAAVRALVIPFLPCSAIISIVNNFDLKPRDRT
jgi:hypothetical protein